jgi:hypothetical protein
MINKIQIGILLIATLINGCSINTVKNKDVSEATVANKKDMHTQTKSGITVSMQPEPYEFKDAGIKLIEPQPQSQPTAGSIKFSFQVDNYSLGNQTPDADSKLCANSAKGQHIHYIIDNQPYKAYYAPTFEETVFEGHHTVLAFLSRSYHESIKSTTAYVIFNLEAIGKSELTGKATDLKSPHLFYSRPKGEYVGKEVKKILLDFYLVNSTLSETGNKVRVTINGTDFVLAQWKAYIIEGLPMGENTIRLELIDKDGKLIAGPFNDSGVRKITLNPEEPIIPSK